MRTHLAFTAAALLAAAVAPAAASDTPPPRPLPAEPPHTEAITAEEFRWAAAWLSDDARAGRDTGTEECRQSARWIAGRMKAMGLAAPEAAKDHLLSWEMPGGEMVPEECILQVALGDAGPAAFVAGTDYVALDGGAEGDVEAPAVFAGFGIRAPHLKYDDFAGIDCQGKVVVVFRHTPREPDRESRWNAPAEQRHKWLLSKVQNAKALGAAAVVVVNDPLHHQDDPLGGAGLGARGIGIPVLLARRGFADEVLKGCGRTPAELQKAIDDADAPVPVDTGPLRIRVKVVRRKSFSENVVGILRGADERLREEWVVLGAHYDHVGKGFGGGSNPAVWGQIHNGADDNASGTAALLEVAESLAMGTSRPRRSVLFVAFSGEEKGLLGSAAFVKAPPIAKESMVAMVNLDMVGRYRPGQFQIVGTDTGSTLRALVDGAAKGLDLVYEHTNAGLSASDGYNFYLAGIPTLFLFTGLHEDYHKPGDDWWLLDAEGAARVATLAARVTRALADADGRPVHAKVPPESMALLRRRGVTLGVRLDEADASGRGALVRTVPERGPAHSAGIRPGDRIVSVGGREVKDADGLRAGLNYSKPGDTVAVKVLRGEETLEVQVAFPAPPGPVFGVTFDASASGEKGVPVLEVTAGSVAEAAGVKAGDRILSFAGKEVADAAALRALLRAAKAGETVKVVVLREGKEVSLDAAYPR